MDRRERFEDPQEALRAALLGWQAGIWTAMPGIIESFNAEANTVVVQPAIIGKRQMPDGSFVDFPLPLCLDVPIDFPSGGGFTLTFPLAQGDEGLIVFASRCIDSWWQSGGIQNQAEFRMHNLSDGFFLPGFRSKPRAIVDVSLDSVQLRSDDGVRFVEIDGDAVRLVANPTNYVEVKATGVTKVRASTSIDLNGVVITAAGVVTAPGEGTFNGHTVGAHKHGGVTAGAAQTATPTG